MVSKMSLALSIAKVIYFCDTRKKKRKISYRMNSIIAKLIFGSTPELRCVFAPSVCMNSLSYAFG